jgi:hypothetical protein
MHRYIKGAAALAAVAASTSALAVTGIAGAAPAATHSGAIAYNSVEEGNGSPVDVVTGAIVDHGTDKSIGETYQKVVLSKGTFEVYAKQFNKSFKVKADKKACTVIGTGTGSNLAISHGTGAYAGITGTISIKAEFVDIGIIKNGKCQNLNTSSAAAVSSFSGTGHVSY